MTGVFKTMSFSINLAEYYDKNTSKFLSLGHGKKALAIHRAVWFKGIKSRYEAIQFQNECVLSEIQKIKKEPVALLDLGCGVGGTLFELCQKSKQALHLYGITNSFEQKNIAEKWQKRLSQKKIQFVCGDFHNLPKNIPQVDIIYAIESFVHSNNIDLLIAQIRSRMKKNSVCLLIDDFLFKKPNIMEKEIKIFQENWFAPNLITMDTLQKKLVMHGLTINKIEKLNPYLELNRMRDYFIQFICSFSYFLQDNNYTQSLRGGNALRSLLLKNVLQYCLIKIVRQDR